MRTRSGRRNTISLSSSHVDGDLALGHRCKGLLRYTTERIAFASDYIVQMLRFSPHESLTSSIRS